MGEGWGLLSNGKPMKKEKLEIGTNKDRKEIERERGCEKEWKKRDWKTEKEREREREIGGERER